MFCFLVLLAGYNECRTLLDVTEFDICKLQTEIKVTRTNNHQKRLYYCLLELKIQELKAKKKQLEIELKSYEETWEDFDDTSDAPESSRDFHCGQLVADVYKLTGVALKVRLSHLYTPSDFSSNVFTKGLLLEKGYQFSPEIVMYKLNMTIYDSIKGQLHIIQPFTADSDKPLKIRFCPGDVLTVKGNTTGLLSSRQLDIELENGEIRLFIPCQLYPNKAQCPTWNSKCLKVTSELIPTSILNFDIVELVSPIYLQSNTNTMKI